MRKSVALLIALIYIVSVVIVGVIGIQMRIYDEVVYVENIVCTIRGYEPTKVDFDAYGNHYDYYYFIKDCDEGVKFEIHSQVVPENATNEHVQYFMDNHDSVTMETNDNDNIAVLTFSSAASIEIHVSSNDGRIVEKLIWLRVKFKS